MRTRCFDIVVIGSTRSGVAAAEVSRRRGLAVALIGHTTRERDREEYWHEVLGRAKRIRAGWIDRIDSPSERRKASQGEWTAAQLSARERASHESVSNICGGLGVSFFDGPARFLSPSTVEVDRGLRITAKSFVVATGSIPRRGGRFGYDADVVGDCDQILSAPNPPRDIVIVGADWIGCEWAFVCAALGANVTLLDRRSRLLRALDPEMQLSVKSSLLSLGVEIVLGEEIQFVKRGENGECIIRLASGREEITERMLVLAGRVGNTDGLGLKEIGVHLDPKQHVIVNESFRSSVENVFSIGAVADPTGLSPSGVVQAEIAVGSAVGDSKASTLPHNIPWVLQSSIEIAMCGVTDEVCRQLGIEAVEGRAVLADLPDDPRRVAKVVVRANDRRLMGVQLAGPGAAEAICLACQYIERDLNVETCMNMVPAPDTMMELLLCACQAASDRIRRMAPQSLTALRVAPRQESLKQSGESET